MNKNVMSPEERAARRAEYAARDRAHAAVIRAKRAGERALAKAADTARLAAEVDRIRSEVRLGLKPPAGRLASVDLPAMLLLGPLGAVGCGAALLRTCEVLVGRGRHPVPSLLSAGRWQDEAAMRAALEAFRPKLAAIGLRVCRRKAGWRLARLRIVAVEQSAALPLGDVPLAHLPPRQGRPVRRLVGSKTGDFR